ncbi:MAG: hypothetical protein OXH57_05715 [Ekhidna sp.]|nr:hypothetical protein [Ekhidna sp.]
MKHIDYNHEIKKINSTKKLRELFLGFMSLAKETLTEYNHHKNPDYYQIVYQNLFQRLYIGISAIETLFDKFNRNRYFKYPIAIQMRTCILDSITIAYLALFIDKKNQNKFKEQVIKLNHPVARELNDEIEEMIKKDKSEYKKHLERAEFHFPDNFTNGQRIKLKKIQELKPRGMAKALKGTPLEWYGEIYKLYQHYSKYEHFGTVSKTLIEFDAEFEFDNLTFSTFYVLQAAYMTMKFMEVDTVKIEKMRKLRDKIREVEPTFDKRAHTANKG